MIFSWWYRLYANMTPSEKALEPAVAALGEPYRVQHPFPGHRIFADFALLNRKLIIEVDGDSHNKPAQKKKDLEHMIVLKGLGWDVVRVTNESAQADPAGTVKAALSETPQTLSQLVEKLARFLLENPDLAEPKKRAAAGRKRASGRRKQPAGRGRKRAYKR